MSPGRKKVFCYVVRTDAALPALLVFESLDEPGFEVPKGAVEAGESLEGAVYREVLEESGSTAASSIGTAGWR